ncbi:MAG: hypothetical protein QF496_02755 [Dehalococcoidia bacterium]|jgi:hypothetical protein|nr:hypothetical protein [Dehalococcoidia bacterium]
MTEKNNQEEKQEEKQEPIDYSSAKQGKFFINLLIALILLIPIMYIMNMCQG